MNDNCNAPALLFDGPCVLCQRSVRVLVSHLDDSDGAKALCLAPLQSDWARLHAPGHLLEKPYPWVMYWDGATHGWRGTARLGLAPWTRARGRQKFKPGLRSAARRRFAPCDDLSSWGVPCLGRPALNPTQNRRKPGCPSPWWPQDCLRIRPSVWREAPKRGALGSPAGWR